MITIQTYFQNLDEIVYVKIVIFYRQKLYKLVKINRISFNITINSSHIVLKIKITGAHRDRHSGKWKPTSDIFIQKPYI